MKKFFFNKVVIAGLGLMGGSLGLALKRQGLAREVVGLVRRPQTIREGLAMGAIDRGTCSIPDALQDAALVVLGCPVSQTPPLLAAMLPHLPAGCLVTDVGSTKQVMLTQIRKMLPKKLGFVFASSHPMAGSEKAGVRAARPDLYHGALCMLIQETWTPTQALERLELMWRQVGCAQVRRLRAAEHDELTAAASHLPHATAVCLANVVADLSAAKPAIREVAASGFRDTTRIAAGLPAMWTDILLTNRTALIRDLGHLQRKMDRLVRLLKQGQAPALEKELARAQAFRVALEPRRPSRRHGESA